MSMQFTDQLILKDDKLQLKDAFGQIYDLPNLTTLLHLYDKTTDPVIKKRLYDILDHDLGTLLVVEIMIDATHEVTQRRLETGEISKNMKHVHDYYVILKSHYALAKSQFEQLDISDESSFETCHFALFPYGLVIKRSSFSKYHNVYTDLSVLKNLLHSSPL